MINIVSVALTVFVICIQLLNINVIIAQCTLYTSVALLSSQISLRFFLFIYSAGAVCPMNTPNRSTQQAVVTVREKTGLIVFRFNNTCEKTASLHVTLLTAIGNKSHRFRCTENRKIIRPNSTFVNNMSGPTNLNLLWCLIGSFVN
jgi:hypothetical protein